MTAEHQNNVIKDAAWYMGTRLAVAAGIGAGVAAFLVEPAADAIHPFHGGTSDMVACQRYLHADGTTNFPSNNVPDGCNYWKNTVVLTHIGESYKLVPTEGGKQDKKVITQQATEFYTYPSISDFNSENRGGAQAADAARDTAVTRYQHEAGTWVAVITLAGAFAISGWRRYRQNRPPEMPKTRSSGGRPHPHADIPASGIVYGPGE